MSMDKLIKPRLQTNWDWRAAGNFIGGGSGTGLLLAAALASASGASYPLLGTIGLALVALGLFCVWMEIGRPLRALNVFRHAQTSWMTREALVAPLLFACGAGAVWTGAAGWIWATALLALLFLYCQARILRAAKGIPAWRAQGTLMLIVITGLTEGAGLCAVLLALTGAAHLPGALSAALLILLALRIWAWRSYRAELRAAKTTPPKAIAALDLADARYAWGSNAALATLVVAALSPFGSSPWLVATAGVLAVAGGWLIKYTMVVRASFNQGYAMPRVPVRGSGVAT
jgi:phenylacetyl-CoA:acceptor oxidoreductase subunit 2